MPYLLTLSDLNNYLTEIQTPISGYDSRLFDYLSDLYVTGCRPQELLRRDLWTDYDATYMQLQPVKGNNPRLIPKSVLSASFFLYFESADQLYQPFTSRKLRYFFRQYWLLGLTTVGQKAVELYLFRHRYIKQLYENGLTVAQIMDVMGVTTESIIQGYIDSEIYSEFEPEDEFCAEYQAVLDYGTAQGYTLPSAGQQITQNQLMLDLIACGAFDLVDYLHVPANDGSEQFGCINWKDPGTYALGNPNAMTWTADVGYISTGSPKYLTTGYNPSTSPQMLQNDAAFGAYFLAVSTSNGYHGGTNPPTAMIMQYYVNGANNVVTAWVNNDDPVSSISTSLNLGLFWIDRSVSTDLEFYIDGALDSSSSRTSNGLTNRELLYFALNNGSPVAYCDGTIAITFAGRSLAAIASDFNLALSDYLTAIGAI